MSQPGKLKGSEFNRLKRLLAGEAVQARPASAKSQVTSSESPAPEPLRNVPLAEFMRPLRQLTYFRTIRSSFEEGK